MVLTYPQSSSVWQLGMLIIHTLVATVPSFDYHNHTDLLPQSWFQIIHGSWWFPKHEPSSTLRFFEGANPFPPPWPESLVEVDLFAVPGQCRWAFCREPAGNAKATFRRETECGARDEHGFKHGQKPKKDRRINMPLAGLSAVINVYYICIYHM